MTKGTTSYRIKNEEGLYYLTFATVEWVDVFTRQKYQDILIESLEYCIKHKGLNLHAWVIMSNHVHFIMSAKEEFMLSDIAKSSEKV